MAHRIELMPMSSIREAEVNPKEHDLEGILASFARYGFGEAPMLDERTQRLVAGHGRLAALAQLRKDAKAPPAGVELRDDEWLVPILRGWSSRDDAHAKGYLLASNKLTEVGGWNKSELDAMLLELAASGDDALSGTGFGAADVDRLLAQGDSENEAVAPVAEPWVKPGEATLERWEKFTGRKAEKLK